MTRLWVLMLSWALGADAPLGDYYLPLTVRAGEYDRENVPLEVVVPFPHKLRYNVGLRGRTVDWPSLRLVEVDAEGRPMSGDLPLAVEGLNHATRLAFTVPGRTPRGTERHFRLFFRVTGALLGPTRRRPPPLFWPTDDFAFNQLGRPWDFNEGDPPVFTGAWHCTVREGRGAGGFLIATADGEYSSPVIGRVEVDINADEYHLLRLRARKAGPTQNVSLLVNGKGYPADERGNHLLGEEFRTFTFDLRRLPEWKGTVHGFTLRWGYTHRGMLTPEDQIILDWIRLERTPPQVIVGLIAPVHPGVAPPGPLRVLHATVRPRNDSVHLYLHNVSQQPVTIARVALNGEDVAAGMDKPLRERTVTWFRWRPNPIPPGEVADVTLKLRRPPGAAVEVGLQPEEGEPFSVLVPVRPERLRLSHIAFSPDLRTVHLYARWLADTPAPPRLTLIALDGKPQPIRPGQFFRGLAYVRLDLSEPLKRGSYHVFEVAAGGARAAYQVRALPLYFPLGCYGNATPSHFRDYAEHGCNHYISFGYLTPEQFDWLHQYGLTGGSVTICQPLVDRETKQVVPFDPEAARASIEAVKDKPAFLYHHLVDEPDVQDYHAGGLGATAQELVQRASFCEQVDPAHYTFVQIDNTYRTGNYYTYGEVADVCATHRYSLGRGTREETLDSKAVLGEVAQDIATATRLLKDAAEPRPIYMVTQFFNLGRGRKGRPPTGEEMRWQGYLLLAHGAKGVLHYIHSGSAGKGEGARTPELWAGLTALHGELQRVGRWAAQGENAPLAQARPKEVAAYALLCGEAVLVILLNRQVRSTLETFLAPPVDGVQVTVALPPWKKAEKWQVVHLRDETFLPCSFGAGKVTFEVPQVKVAEAFLVQSAKLPASGLGSGRARPLAAVRSR
ncbi:MAG TPA: hypothetical protein EYP85_15635 [Armatimonadetes bacterium]|nr:hypothetical protein [Armatimonadota bacterium]